MGNMNCPVAEATHLASLARDICPFPDYTPNPLFPQLLSINSSRHLTDHYMAIQASLTPQQLDSFTKDLRSTFGKGGQVTLGGVGVVALSLAVLFDTLARQAKGEWVPESGPIPGLFHKEREGSYHPMVPLVNDYLRLVPHIANNPIRMRQESERYYRMLHHSRLDRDSVEKFTDVRAVNGIVAGWFTDNLRFHLIRMSNLTEVESIERSVFKAKYGYVEGGDGAKRRRRQAELRFRFSLNCDPEAASQELLAEVERSSETKEMYENCKPKRARIRHTVLHYIASLALQDILNQLFILQDPFDKALIAQTENFDLKANSRGNWGI